MIRNDATPDTPNEAKIEAKRIVNEFYQPLGYLHCNVSPDTLWLYAKARGLFCVDEIIKAWQDNGNRLDHTLIQYYQSVRSEIELL